LTPDRLNLTTAQMNLPSAQRFWLLSHRDGFFTAASSFFLPSPLYIFLPSSFISTVPAINAGRALLGASIQFDT
jgi:hypothetical protein